MLMDDKRTPKRISERKPIGTRIKGRPRKRWSVDIEDRQIMEKRRCRKQRKERAERKRITEKAKTQSGLYGQSKKKKTYHMYCPTWVKYGIRFLCKLLLGSCQFHKNRCREGIKRISCTVKPYDFFFQIKNASVQSVYCSLFTDFFQADFTALLDSQIRDEIKL
jgi:hypothetical protein